MVLVDEVNRATPRTQAALLEAMEERQITVEGETRPLPEPFDQIDEDEARARLDRALIVEVLGLPASLCEADGPLALLRRKLAAEPQIHGGKRTRVVFEGGGERTERRPDRHR